MKYQTLVVTICVFLAGCISREQKLIDEAESFLKESLNDPYSYKKESLLIVDTITRLELQKEFIKQGLSLIELELKRWNISVFYENSLLEDYIRLSKTLIPEYQPDYDAQFINGEWVFTEKGSKLVYTRSNGYTNLIKEKKDKILALNKKIDSLDRKLIEQKNIVDSINRISIDTSSILIIDLLAKYRAKNTFGAYEKQEKKIAYDFILKEFSIYEDYKSEIE